MNVPHSIRLSHLGRNNQLHMCSVTNIIQRNQPASRYRRTMIYKHIALSEKSGNRRRSNRISKLIHNSRTIHIGYIRFHPSNSYQPLFFKAHQNQIIRFNCICRVRRTRSEEHTSELQSRVDISYAVFCLKKIFLMIRRPPRSTRSEFYSPTILKISRLRRSEEHTSELQSRVDISYAVFCLKKTSESTVG